MRTRKWKDLRAARAARPGAAERIEAARAKTEAEIAAYEADQAVVIAEVNADVVADAKSGAFDEEFMMGIAHERASAASNDESRDARFAAVVISS